MALPVQKFTTISLLSNIASHRKSYFYNVSGFASYLLPPCLPPQCIQMEKWNINNNNSKYYITINNICHNYRKQCKYQKLVFVIKKQWQCYSTGLFRYGCQP